MDIDKILEQAGTFSDRGREECESDLCGAILTGFKQMTAAEFKSHFKDLVIDKAKREYVLQLSFPLKN